MKKLGVLLWLIAYCSVIWLALDYVYTTYAAPMGPSPRVYSAIYSHGLVPKFDGDDRWGASRYRFFTNSLGFRDFAARDVPLKSTTRRVLLIGDSFTEGTGVPFEQSFAGLLYAAGQRRADRIEFLNAGSTSYRPTIYYKKIKHLLDQGLSFDEVVVFSDISDVPDEAMTNACIDDAEQRPNACVPLSAIPPGIPAWNPRDYFNMTIRVFNILRYWTHWLTGVGEDQVIRNNPRAIWTVSDALVGAHYHPLGVEGGIQRSLAAMQALADLLRSRGIPLTIAVYPWPTQLAWNDRNSRQVKVWQNFCEANCARFMNLFPAFFAFKNQHQDWYERLFIRGDVHFSPEGNELVYRETAPQLLDVCAAGPCNQSLRK
jgi:hypothetical protein